MRPRWAAAFGAAYEDFCRRVDVFEAEQAGEELDIDPYASESPAEFFAVLSEYFFELPEVLSAEYPAVYERDAALLSTGPPAETGALFARTEPQ
jgi:Mlc titration factor MtfA (ptsG expression regulator)